MAQVSETLKERGNRYGDFTDHARITQNIKRAMQDSPNWKDLSDDKKEGLEIKAHKIGRVLNGDPEYADNFHDIGGYAKLCEDRCQPVAHIGRTGQRLTKVNGKAAKRGRG